MIKIKIFIEPQVKNFEINKDSLQKLIESLLHHHNFKNAILSFIFSPYEILNKLKKKFFKIDSITDVIAFNLNEKNELLEGEIYISPYIAKKNSKEFNNSFDDEIKRLIIHGTLHLIGYLDDNKVEKSKMNSIENKFLKLNNLKVVS